LPTIKIKLVKSGGAIMLKSLVTAMLLAASVAGCADEPQPPVLQPTSHQSVPLPPVKPELPRGGAQQSAFTDW
jgi:hypothetical protein